ncbi:glycosyltransferase [Geotalea uraniireducens]|nr:glycosyltransferase [Geotalea uraniireducens]
MKILYLYSEVMPYNIPVFEKYVQKYNAEVHVVHWDHKKLTPYKLPKLDNVIYYNRSDYTKHQLKQLANKVKPDIVYISGWMDKDYLAVVKNIKDQGVPVVTGFDDQWKGDFRQRLGSFVFPFLLKKYFSHSWVAGPSQFEFAKRLGFKDSEIISNLYSCNTLLFNKAMEYLEIKTKNYPKYFLYVGRFVSVKGIDLLVDAYKSYQSKYNGNWKLICIGNGDLKYLFENNPGIEVFDFLNQAEILAIIKRAGVFILPSRFEPWGVVVHEFVSAGMPLILSENVGARSTFLIDNFNGLSFTNNSAENLAKAMSTISSKTDSELIEMSKNSFFLSNKINPEIVAASFMSILI